MYRKTRDRKVHLQQQLKSVLQTSVMRLVSQLSVTKMAWYILPEENSNFHLKNSLARMTTSFFLQISLYKLHFEDGDTIIKGEAFYRELCVISQNSICSNFLNFSHLLMFLFVPNTGNWRFVSNFCKQEVPISCILISSPCKCIAAGSKCGIVRHFLYSFMKDLIIYL